MRIRDWCSDVCSSDLHFHGHGAGRRDEGDRAGMKGAEPEAELQHQRQQEGQRADTDAEQRSAEHAGAEGRDAPQVERSEERRVGNEGVSTVRSRTWQFPTNKKSRKLKQDKKVG